MAPPAHRLSLLLLLGAVASGLAPAPARAEDAPGGPRLVFDKEVHEFGAAAQEQELEAVFAYRNDGDAPLEGLRAIGDCGCYGVTLSASDLAPGESGTLRVNFRTLMFSGRVTKRIKVLTPALPGSITVLRLTVDVVAGVVLDPGRLWFGDVLVGTAPSKTVVAKWHTTHGQPFEVTGVEVPGYDLDIRQEPFEERERPDEEPTWKGTSITVAFKEAPPLGMFSATALVRTNHPDYPRISLPLTANVTGRVWVQSRTVYFGWIEQGKSKKTSLLIRPFDETVDLGTVGARARDGRVSVRVEPHPMGREKGWWRLLVEVPEGTEPGKLDDVIEVHAEVPGEEVTLIDVRGEVYGVER